MFTTDQKIMMEKYYLENKTTREDKIYLAEKFNLPIANIMYWFGYRNRAGKKNRKRVDTLENLKNRSILENFYSKNNNPTINQIIDLAIKCNKSRCNIKQWFARKNKKHNKFIINQTSESKERLKEHEYNHNSVTPENRIILYNYYEKNKYPSENEIEEMVEKCKMTKFRIRIWFSNRRTEDKKGIKRQIYEQIKVSNKKQVMDTNNLENLTQSINLFQ